MRVLMIERNELASRILKAELASSGFEPQSCESCEDAAEIVKHCDYDAIVVGRSFAGSDLASVKQLRASDVGVPILVLLDDEQVSSRIAALGAGADDCLSKPFHKAELSARLRAVIRRSKALPHSVARIGNIEIDLETKAVSISGQKLHLTTTEYRMLETLALRKGRTVPKEALFDMLYDGREGPAEHVISVFICKLRKKIAALNQGESYITTAWGGGYQMSPPQSAQAA